MAGLRADQCRDLVEILLDLGLQRWRLGGCLLKLCLQPIDVGIRRRAKCAALARKVQRALLQHRRALQQMQPKLRIAEMDIVLRYFGRELHLCVRQRCFLRGGLGSRALDGSSRPAE